MTDRATAASKGVRLEGPQLPEYSPGRRDPGGPRRRRLEPVDLRLGHVGDVAIEGLEQQFVAAGVQLRLESLRRCGIDAAMRGVRRRPAFVQHELAEVRRTTCGTEGDVATEGVTQQVDRYPSRRGGRVHHGRDVVVLPFGGVVRPVSTGATAAPVDGVDRGLPREERRDQAPGCVVGRRTRHQHQRPARSGHEDGDLRASAERT